MIKSLQRYNKKMKYANIFALFLLFTVNPICQRSSCGKTSREVLLVFDRSISIRLHTKNAVILFTVDYRILLI